MRAQLGGILVNVLCRRHVARASKRQRTRHHHLTAPISAAIIYADAVISGRVRHGMVLHFRVSR